MDDKLVNIRQIGKSKAVTKVMLKKCGLTNEQIEKLFEEFEVYRQIRL